MSRQNFRKTLVNGIESWAILIEDGRAWEDEIRRELVRCFLEIVDDRWDSLLLS